MKFKNTFRLPLRLEFPFRPRKGEPEIGEVFIGQRRVYIMPTGAGCAFVVMLVMLFIGAINYNLSLGFALTFVLAACALIDMHLTFRNLAFLYLSSGHNAAVFAGQEASFAVRVMNRRKHQRYAIWLDFIGVDLADRAQAVDLAAMDVCNAVLSTATQERGWLSAPRVRLHTRFPLGFLRAWCYWQPDGVVLVYPQPESMAASPPLPMSGLANSSGHADAGHEDFAGVRAYRTGDALKHLAWRQMAKRNSDGDTTLMTKHFDGGVASDLVIDYATLPHAMDVEAKLSRMTRWIMTAEMLGLPYAFQIGGIDYPTAIGPAHQQACLEALALYEGGV
ncbi:DUF58 domain-containing protein [Glaciimonas sp. GG7]